MALKSESSNGKLKLIDDVTNIGLEVSYDGANSAISTIGAGNLTVDGRDVATDGTKLDGVATGANNYSKPVAETISYITGLQTALDAKTTPTYVDASIANLVNGAPATLDTLNELAIAVQNAEESDTISALTTVVGEKLPKAGGAMTGAITTNSTFDGRDVATDGSKLDGIASGATNVTNNNQISNGAGYVTSSGNTIIGTDSDIDTSGANVIDALVMTDGVITSHSVRTMTLGNLGFTGATNANYITNNNQITNGAGYITGISSNALTNVSQTFTNAQRGEITSYSGGGTITLNMNDSNNFSSTLTGNRTLANPSNLTVGQSGSIFITQDGTGSRTLAFGSYWDFSEGTAPTLSTSSSAVDRIDYIVRTTSSIHAVVSLDVK